MINARVCIQLLLLTILFIFGNRSVKAENIVSPERVYDLAFSNCTELEVLLKTQVQNIPSFDKLKLAENLGKIITLRTPSSSQFPSASSPAYNAKTFDVSLTLNPNSENKAKECALKNLTALLPESIISIPSLISASRDTSLPRFLKVLMLEEARSLAKAIEVPMKDYTLTALATEFNKNKQILNDDILIPTLLPIVQLHRDFFRSIALEHQSMPIITALRILDPLGKSEAPALIKELLSTKPSSTKIFILKVLSHYPEQVASILEVLPKILNNLTSTEAEALLELISKLADNQLNLFPDLISDSVGESLLHLLSMSTDKHKNSLAKTARELSLNSKSKLCSDSAVGKDHSNLNFGQQIYLASLCSLKNSSLEILKKLNESKSLENLIISLVLISKNNSLRNSYLVQAHKELEKLKPSISPREYRDAGYYILYLENKNPTSSSKSRLSKLAEELISEEPSYPSIIDSIIIESAHPSLVYFTSLGKESVQPVAKLLKNKKSAFLRRQGLAIVSSNSYLAYPDLFPLIENLIADSDLDIRRLAYQVLSKRALKYPSSAKIKVVKNVYSQFYGARLRLQFTAKNQLKEREATAQELFTSISSLKCQEASVPLNFISKEDIIHLSIPIKENAERNFVECLKDKSPFGKRSISSLEFLSPLSDKTKQKLENILIQEKLPQLTAKDGIKYLTLLYSPEISSKIPKPLAINIFTNMSLKDQAIYADWLTSNQSDISVTEPLISEYLDDSIKELVQELYKPKDSKDKEEIDSVEKNIDKLTNILDKAGRELQPLAIRLSENSKKEIIKYADSQTDNKLSLEIKSLLCPYLSFKDCNITIKPSLEYTLENPISSIKEMAIMLDRNIPDTTEEQLLLSSAIEYRLVALIQQGNMQTLTNSKLPKPFLSILEKTASGSEDSSLSSIARFVRNSMAPLEQVR